MKDDVYKKMLEDRIVNINASLDNIRAHLDEDTISYVDFLGIESILYNDLITCRHELINLERKAVGCLI